MSAYQCTSDSVEKDEAYKLMLDNVGQGLSMEMLESLKYQCLDHIGSGRLEKIKAFDELFLVLEQRDVICAENVDFLILCLENIAQTDLLTVVQQYKDEWLNTDEETLKAYNDLDQGSESKMSKHQSSNSSTNNATPSQIQSDAVPFETDGFAHGDGMLAPAAPLDPSHESVIYFVSNRLSADWQMTARHLGISDDAISAAQYNWPRDLRKQIYETFAQFSRFVCCNEDVGCITCRKL